jgi:uncharacterized protein (TIGR04222 family)
MDPDATVSSPSPSPRAVAADPALLERLRRCRFDPPGARLGFAAKLAQDQGWSLAKAERVEAEYRRFLYLAITAPHLVCPSEAVDQAWHQHLLDTRRYWLEFCPQVLGQPLHHSPSRGGPEELQRHREGYERTLASYRASFGEAPPSDLWPPPQRRFAAPRRGLLRGPGALIRAGWTAVGGLRAGRLQRPWLRSGLVPLLAGALCISGCASNAAIPSPLDLPGPVFLLFYGVLIWGAFQWVAGLRQWLEQLPSQHDPEADLPAVELAFLGGGRQAALRTALLSLITEGWISLEQGVATVLRTRPRTFSVARDDLKWSVLQRLQHAEPLGVAVDGVLEKLARDGSLFQPLERSLRRRGWLLSLRRTAVIQGLSLGVWGMVWSIGTWRLLAGMEAERPVGFLLSVQFSLGVVIVNLLLNPPRLSHPARRLLERRTMSCQDTNGCDTGAQMLAAFALIGTAALPPAVAATLPATWSPSSSSSSDAVGAGCGCGGCGGCGG